MKGNGKPKGSLIRFMHRQANVTVREAVGAILSGLQRCCLVVDEDNLLEGIMTLTDLELEAQRAAQAVARGEMEPLDVRKIET